MGTDTTKRSEPTVQRGEEGAKNARRGETPAEVAALDGLGQLREILFGAVQRDLERRIQRADAHLVTRAHELEQEGRRRLEMLEAHLVRETEALTSRLERELVERGDMVRAMSREHRESSTALEQRVAKLEERIVHAQRELRQELLAQAKNFFDEVHRLRHEFAETLERELGLGEGALDELEHGDERRPGR